MCLVARLDGVEKLVWINGENFAALKDAGLPIPPSARIRMQDIQDNQSDIVSHSYNEVEDKSDSSAASSANITVRLSGVTLMS